MGDHRANKADGSVLHEVLHAANVETVVVTSNGVFPNNPKLPLLIYRKALNPETPDLASQVQSLFAENRWGGSWIDGIFDFHHYHSTAHEVLAVCGGEAQVRFGGEHGITQTVSAGDVVFIPAGVAHKNLGASDDFVVVGAYPQGQDGDMCYGRREERPDADKHIVRVPLPESDPLYGPHGPLLEHWRP